jgi:hypothetical protein
MKVTWQPVRVGRSGYTPEEDGRLVFVDGKVAAILVCRSDDFGKPDLEGSWFIEAGFGPISGVQETFPSFQDATSWILRRFKDWEYLMRQNRASH